MKALLQLAGLAIAVVFAYLAFGHLDMATLTGAFGSLDWGWVVVGVTCLSAGYALRIARWQFMLRHFSKSLGYGATIGPFMASFALNNVLPLRVGDVARSFAFREQLGAAPSQVAATLVLERLLDLISLIILFAVGLALLPAQSAWLSTLTSTLAPLLGMAVVILSIPLLVPLKLVRILDALQHRFKLSEEGLPGRIFAFLRNSLNNIAPFRAPMMLLGLGALSLVSWILEGTLFLAVAIGLGLVDLNYGPWFSLSSSTLATLIPSTPGYVGTFDYFGKQGLMAFGADSGLAAVHILICHAAIWLLITIIGGLYLLRIWGFGALTQLRGLGRTKTEEGAADGAAG